MYVCFLLDACKYRIFSISPVYYCITDDACRTAHRVYIQHRSYRGSGGKIQPAGKLEIDIEEDGSSGQCVSYTE